MDENQADIGLIAACQQGDHRAFRQVFEIYRDRVYGLCRRMAGNDQDAEDLSQEVFLWAFRRIGSFRGEATLGTWLYRIAANHCLSALRKQRPPLQSMEELEQRQAEPRAPGSDPEEQLVRQELAGRVEAAVAELPENLRLIFVLGTQLGLRYREIGQIAGCSEDAVKVRIHRARKRVRDLLKPYLEG